MTLAASVEPPGQTQVAVSTARITPRRLLPLFGFNDRIETCEGVRDELEANVLSMRTAGGVIHLVSVDTLYAGDIRAGLLRSLGLRDEQLLVLASHSHGAPGVDAALTRLGPTDQAFVDDVVQAISTSIHAAHWNSGVTVRWAAGSSGDLFVNRRRPILGVGIPLPKLGRVVQAPHPKGPVDRTVRTILFEVDGAPLAILWGASCHPVCCPTPHRVSADFPGEVRASLRAAFGDIPVLFAQGFSGDVRPRTERRTPPRTPLGLVKYALAYGRQFVPQDEAHYAHWCAELSRCTVGLCRETGDSAPLEVESHRVRLSLTGWTRCPVAHLVGLAPGLRIAAFNAEVMACRVTDLHHATAAPAHAMVVPAGCCDELLGYWPTDSMCLEGGYEAAGSQCYFPALDWTAVGGPDAAWNRLLERLRAAVAR